MHKQSFFEKITGSRSVEEKIPQRQIQQRTQNQQKINNPRTEQQKQINPEIRQTTQAPERKKESLPESEGQLVLDIYQNEGEIIIKSTLAGVKPEDLDITITNDMLSIKGMREKDEEVKQKNYYYQECYWGPFSRSVILPTEVEADQIKASLKNGILTVKMLKSEKLKTKKISVIEE